MAHDIVNNKRSKSVIRVVGTGGTRIDLADLEVSEDESISDASITSVLSASDGVWSVYRGNDNTGTLVLDIPGGVDWPLVQYDITIANTSSANIYVTNSGSNGTLILTVSKVATYSPALTEI
jgi:hypothetical protein